MALRNFSANSVDQEVDETAVSPAPDVDRVTTDAPDAPSDHSVSAPVDEVVAQTSDEPVDVEPDAPVEEVAPPVTVAPIAELPDGLEYPIVITTAAGEARFESPEDTVTLDPELAALVAETPFAEVANDQPEQPAEETV